MRSDELFGTTTRPFSFYEEAELHTCGGQRISLNRTNVAWWHSQGPWVQACYSRKPRIRNWKLSLAIKRVAQSFCHSIQTTSGGITTIWFLSGLRSSENRKLRRTAQEPSS